MGPTMHHTAVMIMTGALSMITVRIRLRCAPAAARAVRSGIRPDATFSPPIRIGSLSARLHLRFA